MTRLLVLGDVHLGAGTDFGLAPFGFDSRLHDQQRVLERATELVHGYEVEAVLFAGDLAHNPKGRLTPDQENVWRRGFLELIPATPVLMIPGNHDVTAADRASAIDIFGAIGRVNVARTPGVVAIAGVRVGCLPWTPTHALLAGRDDVDPDAINTTASELLLDVARGLRAQDADILLGHWSMSDAALPSGMSVNDLREVILPAAQLDAIGFRFVAMGHIHSPDMLAPGRFYTGSTAVVDWGETPGRHGCWIIDTDTGAADYHLIDDRPFVAIDLGNVASFEEAVDRLLDSSPDSIEDAIVRVRYSTTEDARVDASAIRRALLEDGARQVFIQPTILRAARVRDERVTGDVAPAAALDLWLTLEGTPPAQAEAARIAFARYLEAV